MGVCGGGGGACTAGKLLFYRPVKQNYGNSWRAAAGRHSEERYWFLLGIIGTGKQAIAWML